MPNSKSGETRNHPSTGFKVIKHNILKMTVPENKRNIEKKENTDDTIYL